MHRAERDSNRQRDTVIKGSLLIFIDLLQSELERHVIPDPGSEVARNTTVLAAKQLRRLLVEELDVPPLRQAALASYRELLPALREALDDPAYDDLERVLTAADAPDWDQVEGALYAVTSALLQTERAGARVLTGQLAGIDARLRDAKEEAYTARSTPTGPRRAAKPPTGGTEAEQARLLAFLQRAFPAETSLRIAGMKQIMGGFSKDTLFLSLEDNVELPDVLVMRRDGPYPGSSVVTEFPVIEKLYAAGVAAPKPYAIDATGEVYGKPFILVSHAPGRTIGDFVVVTDPSREVALDLAEKLARLHAAPFDGIEDLLVGGTAAITDRMAAEIATCDATWKSVVNQHSFVVQAAIDWLGRNVQLADGPRAVLHRDLGAHNMLIHDQAVSAFLDWETAAVGTPAEDLGYVYDMACQMIDGAEFLAAYQAASGFAVDQRQLDYYVLWASVRIVVPISKGVDTVLGGGRKNLSEYYLGDHIVQVLIQRIATTLSRILT
ncbi:MAG: aminoglycoside phosphotransferase [Frankiales bacterium]|nr:aminoglycoside phosphotransferase [Frankiales bacterium]